MLKPGLPTREPLDDPAKIAIGAILVVWTLTALGGGSARDDVLYLVPLRLAAVVGIMVLLLLIPRERLRLRRAPLIFSGAAALVVALQLVPLPPAIWTALPGRAPYAAVSAAAGLGDIWRPITLSPDLTWNALLSLVPPLFFIIAIPVLGRRARSWVLSGLLVTILLSGFLGLLQVAGGAESPLRYYQYTNNMSGIGLFANRNHQAAFLAMGIPLAFWWAMQGEPSRRSGGRLVLAAAAILFLLTAVLTTQSRTGAVVVVLALVLSAVYLLKRRDMRRAGILWIAGGGLFAATLAVLAFGTWAVDRHSVTAVTEDLRVQILPESIVAIRTFFPVGAGYGAFAQVFPRFESVEDLGPLYVNHTHSEVTQILIEGGILSILLLALLLGWLARAGWRAWRAGKGSGTQAAEAQLCTILIALPLVASITDYPLRTPLMGCGFAILAALLSSGGEPARPKVTKDQHSHDFP